MKSKGTVAANKLHDLGTHDLIRALHYGRLTETAGGELVVRIAGSEHSTRHLKDWLIKDPKHDGVRRSLRQAEVARDKARLDLSKKSLAAITQGDAKFFRDIANAVELLAHAKGKPVDKYREAIFMIWWMLEAARFPQTMRAMINNLVRQFPEFDGRQEDLPVQVRRWCKELGLTLAKGKSSRTGWNRGSVEKVLRESGRHTKDADEALLFFANALSPELAKKAMLRSRQT